MSINGKQRENLRAIVATKMRVISESMRKMKIDENRCNKQKRKEAM